MDYAGRIIDSVSADPVAGATVELWINNIMLSRVAADNNGYFKFSSSSSGDRLTVDSASYGAKSFPAPDIGSSPVYKLDREIIQGETAFVTNKKKQSAGLMFGLLALLLLLLKKRK